MKRKITSLALSAILFGLLAQPAPAQQPATPASLRERCSEAGLANGGGLNFCAQYIAYNPSAPATPATACQACAMICRDAGHGLAVCASHCRRACGF